MKSHLSCIAILALAVCGQAAAQPASSAKPDFHIVGAGVISCTDWTKEGKAAVVRAQNQSWILGYLSAFNRFGADASGDVLGSTTNKAALEWLDDYCVKNPSSSVSNAAGALILELERRKTAVGSAP